MIDYEKLENEIGWLQLGDRVFDDLWSRTAELSLIWTTLGLPSGRSIVLGFDRPGYLPVLSEKFDLSVSNETLVNESHLLYVESIPGVEVRQAFSTPGFISSSADRCLVVGDGPGKLKSLISSCSGYFFQRESHLPLHAAVLLAWGRGVALVGGRGAGKTTNTFALATKYPGEVSPLCDDWTSVHFGAGRMRAVAEDRSVSFTESILATYDVPSPLPNSSTHAKRSAAPELLFPAASELRHVDLDVFVGLIPVCAEGRLSQVPADVMAEHILQSAYHYPYVDAELASTHKEAWVSCLPDERCFFFPIRSEAGDYNSLDIRDSGI